MRLITSAIILCFTMAACSAPEQAEAPPAPEPQVIERLPVSLNEVMVALVNQAADPIWIAAWHNPQTDKEWRELERRALQLELGGALLAVPGTGPTDGQWTSDPRWQAWSNQLTDVGVFARDAITRRDLELISKAGDDLVEICEGCHIDFKPDLPTGGMFGELSPNEADLEPEEEAEDK